MVKNVLENTYSESFQDYLEEILRITREKGADVYITSTELAGRMNRKPPTVTEMFGKLNQHGLVEWRKWKGVKLTKKGIQIAQKVLDMHELLEDFLTEVLELNDNEIKHRVACSFEHELLDEPKLADCMQKSIEKNRSKRIA